MLAAFSITPLGGSDSKLDVRPGHDDALHAKVATVERHLAAGG